MNLSKHLISAFIGISASITSMQSGAVDNAATTAANRYENPTTYTITRKGKPIGTHELRFDTTTDELTVSVKSKIRVTILKVPVFSFDYESTEIWKNGILSSATGKVRENNKNTSVSMIEANGRSVLNTRKGKSTVENLSYTSNHWNAGVTNSSRVFNTLTGQASDVSIELVNDSAEVNGIDARHFRYSGDIKADVWYDTSDRWVKLQFKGEDGSNIEYTIDQ